jgi:hypothetical protein
MLENKYYMYSWSERGQTGYRQTCEKGKVLEVHSIGINEAKEKYSNFPDGEPFIIEGDL